MGIRMERQDKEIVLVGNQILVYRRSALEMSKERLEEENERKEATLSKMWEKIRAVLEKEYIIMSRRVQLGDIFVALLMGATISYMIFQIYLAQLHMPVVKVSDLVPSFI
jgi:hypothetical protein